MTRNGKIARLPREVRERLNQRIADGGQGKKLVRWLNSLSKTKEVLEELKAQPINEQNLSDWKAGGYLDWVAQQESVEMIRALGDDAQELEEAGGQPLADKLALWLTARYVVATRLLREKDDTKSFGLLRELCADVVALRKGDHSAERLRIEREQLEFERQKEQEITEEQHRQWADEHHEEILDGHLTFEEKMERMRQIFRPDNLSGCPYPKAGSGDGGSEAGNESDAEDDSPADGGDSAEVPEARAGAVEEARETEPTPPDQGQSSQIKLNQATSHAAHGSDVTAVRGAAAAHDIPYAEQYNECLAKVLRPGS